MAAIIENQHIAKRYKTSFRPNNKSAGFNAGFMSQFSQNPSRSRRKGRSLFASRDRRRKEPHKSSGGSGFSIPVPSVATLAVVAGTVLIALTALKWEDINIKIPGKYAFQLTAVEDEDTERYKLNYAATGISGITAPFQIPENTQSIAENVEAASITTETIETSHSNELMVAFEWQQYKVKKGDSVSAIAKQFGVSIGAIIASNEIRNARRLQEGAALRIPNIDGIPYSVKRGDSLSKISASFNVPLEVILDVNDIKNDAIKAGETIFIPGARMNDMDLRLSLGESFVYPVQSRHITSSYGMRKDPISGKLNFHTGIDLRANTGTAVMAAMDGVVSVVNENWLYGKHIIISHNNGYKTLYAHLNFCSVKQGDRVSRGKKIGEAGNTGYSTGPHLHFGIYDKNGKLVNPIELLN